MNALSRTIALLAFAFIFVQLTQAQSRVIGPKLHTTTLEAQDNGQMQAEAAPQMPMVDIYQNPGQRSIHVHLNRLTNGTSLNITLLAPNDRVVRNQNVHLCTLCGTFDIDLEDEVRSGRHTVIVTAHGIVVTRVIWVE